MSFSKSDLIQKFFIDHHKLKLCKNAILSAIESIISTYKDNGSLFVCGNGGSSADSGHICGELMKGFERRRPLDDAIKHRIIAHSSADQKQHAKVLGESLQQGLPCFDLTAQGPLISAISNDLGGEYIYAQQVMACMKPQDLLIGISTSGNAKNVINAMLVAKSLGAQTLGLTGGDGGQMRSIADTIICVPAQRTADVQEYHLSVYHCICAAVEAEFYKE